MSRAHGLSCIKRSRQSGFVHGLSPFAATVKPLLGLFQQPRISFGMLIQLNAVVIFVMARNLNVVIPILIVMQVCVAPCSNLL